MSKEFQQLGITKGFFKTLFDQSPYAMLILSPDGVVVKANLAWKALWGISDSAFFNNYNITLDKQAQSSGLTSAFNQALTGLSTSLNNIECYPLPGKGTEGEKRFLNVKMLPLGQGEKSIEGIVCILEDRTRVQRAEAERIHYQEQLKQEAIERSKQFEALLQFSTELLTISDPDSVLTFVNTWAQSLLKFDFSSLMLLPGNADRLLLKETIGFPQSMVNTFEVRLNEGLAGFVAREYKVIATEDFKTETRFSTPDIIFEQQITSALAAPMLNKTGLTGVLVGHTRQKRIFSESEKLLYQSFANQAAVAISNCMNQRSLRRSEKRFRHLFESANDAIYLIDLVSNRIVDCNKKALEIGGYTRAEMTRMQKSDLYPPEERTRLDERDRRVAQEESLPVGRSHYYQHKDGSRIPVEISSSLVETDGQKLLMNIVRDVSRRKALEEEKEATALKLRRASRMEAIGLMAGGVAHDLNNILSGVISYPELMMLKLPKDSPVKGDLQKVIASGQRAAGVVADLLTVARGAATVKEIACLNELIQMYMTSTEFNKLVSLYPDISFVSSLTPGVNPIFCSPVHVQKLLMNLVTNAAEAIKGNGEVRVSTCSDTVSSHEQKHGLIPGEYTILQVSDTGTGITQYDLDHIFDPFYTTKKMGRSGTGLGLAVVWNTIQDHEGHVTVESDSKGTSFIVHLPARAGEESCQLSPAKKSLQPLFGTGKLLVVDDERSQRDIASKILSVLGYSVSTVASGEEAITFVERNRPDLVLLDMVMDSGINGRQTYEEIILRSPGQKAIVVSGYSESDDIARVLELGVLGLLKKPYTIEKIGLMVRDALQKTV
jgi:PAS domain S-box-containing protein